MAMEVTQDPSNRCVRTAAPLHRCQHLGSSSPLHLVRIRAFPSAASGTVFVSVRGCHVSDTEIGRKVTGSAL